MFDSIYYFTTGFFELILSNFASVSAVCALILTWHTIKATQKHNRLSVKPNIDIRSHTDGNFLRLNLKNCGLGTAEIYDVKIFINNKNVSIQKLETCLENDFSGCYKKLSCSKLEGRFYISKDEVIPFFGFELLEENYKLPVLDRIYKNYRFEFKYKCMYQNNFFTLFPRKVEK